MIAIIAILAVVVVLTLNPAELLRQSRDANRVSDMATLQSALNLYVTDQAGASSFSLGNTANTGISVPDPAATSTNACGSLGLPSFTSGSWQCSATSTYRSINSAGWIPVNLTSISSGNPVSNLPVDPVNATSSGLFYAYNTNGTQFQVTANLESQKYKQQYGASLQTTYFPEVISGGTQGISALYNPTGLVGYWPMSEGSGSSTIDASGNGNTGTWNGSSINGSHYTGGKVGTYAGTFDGSTNSVSLGSISGTNSLMLAGSNFTITAWIDPPSIPLITARIIDKSTTGYAVNGYGVDLGMDLYMNGATFGFGGSPPTGQWTFITITFFSASSTSLYENGSLVKTDAVTSTIPSATANMSIGAWNTDNARDFLGSIDDVRIYNRALSPAEIMALYNSEK